MLKISTQSFQSQVLSLILHDSKVMGQVRPNVTMDFWKNPVYQQIGRIVLEFFDEHGSAPSIMSLGAMTESYLSDDAEASLFYKKYEEALNFLENPLPDADKEYVLENLSQFIKDTMMEAAIASGTGEAGTGNYPEFAEKVAKAASFDLHVKNNKLTLVDLTENTGMYLAQNKGKPIPTGFPSVDEEMKGGHYPGKCGIIIGGTGTGKSMFLVNLAFNAMKADKRVCYISLENQKENIAQRLTAGLCNEDFYDLQFDPNKNALCQAKMQAFTAAHPETALDIFYFSNRSITCPELESFLKTEYQDSPFPEVILLDYADLLGCSKEYKSEYDNFGLIYAQIVAMTQRFDVALWTATQANRQGRKTRVVDIDNVSDSYKKTWVADVIYTITQTESDKVNKLLFLYSAKMRDTDSGRKHYFQTHFYKSQVKSLEENKYKNLQTAPPKSASLVSSVGQSGVKLGWLADNFNSKLGKTA